MNLSPRRHVRSLSFVSVALWSALIAPATFAVPPRVSSPAPDGIAKPFTLFMGADISIQRGGKLYHVRDVVGESLVIEVNGQTVSVPLRGVSVDLKIENALKLERGAVLLTHIKGEPTYTPGNDPYRKFAENAHMADIASDKADAALAKMNRPGIVGGGGSDEDMANYVKALAEMGSELNTVGYHSQKLQADVAEEMYDAIAISFEIASKRPLYHPYILVTARLHERESKPNEYRNWILAKSLEPIDEHSKKISFVQGGLPPGYTLDQFQTHLYDRGDEIPTSVSPKRVLLTLDEAFQYQLINYLSANKNASLPAAPALAQLPEAFRSRLDQGEYGQTYFVKVGKDGLPGEVFLDQPCTQKVSDEAIEAAVKTVRFKPALDRGKPIEGTAPIKFRKL